MTKPSSTKARRDLPVREAILDVAERLFAEHGANGVSMRELTKLAGANLASVNYHFGSKENLFGEVIARRIRPINARRLELLEAAIAAGGEAGPSLESLLDAFVRPMFEMGATPEQQQFLRQMIIRVFTEADEVSQPVFETQMLPIGQKFAQAIAVARPRLEPKYISIGLFLFIGALVNTFLSARRIQRIGSLLGSVPDSEEMFDILVKAGVAIFDSLDARKATK